MKKIAKPYLGSVARVRFPFFRILSLVLLLGLASSVWGQLDEVTWKTRPSDVANLPEWNGTAANGTYKITSDKTLGYRVQINGVLELYPIGNVTITRGVFPTAGECVFDLTEGDKLFIIGDESNKLTINGGAGNRDDGLPDPDSWNNKKYGPAISCNDDAELWLQNVIIEKFSVVGNHIYNRWGVISCSNNKLNINNPSTLIVRMKDVEMRKCYGGTRNIEHFGGTERHWDCFGRIFSILVGKNDVFMEGVEIHHNLLHEDEDNGHFIVYDRISGMGGIIRSQGNSSGKMVMKNCYIHDNQYRDLDAYTPWQYWNNEANVEDQPLAGQGGAVNWRSGRNYKNSWDGDLIESELIIRNCWFVRNCAKEGGAISTCAKTTFQKDGNNNFTYISKNHAVNGGGLMFWPYNDGQLSYAGDGFNVTLGGEGFNNNGSAYVRVCDNYASQTGGGAYIVIDPTDDVGFDTDNNPRDASFVARFGTGCEIKDNRAPQGAGVTIIDNAAKRHVGFRVDTPDNYTYQMINPVRFKVSGVLSREITIDGANVKDNYTSTEGTFPDEAEGAGIYIAKRRSTDPRFKMDFKMDTTIQAFTEDITGGYTGSNPTTQYYPTQTIRPYDNDDDPGGTMIVNVLSGNISNNHARQYSLTVGNLNQNDYSPFTDTEVTTNPKPGNGGGCYIASLYDIADFVSALDVNIGETGKTLEIFNNDAYTDGGGVYVYYDRTEGRVNQGKVTISNGTIGKTNHPTANKALNGNGGGVCVLGGTVEVRGGNIDWNTASNGLGGGIYISVPNKESTTLVHGGAVISHNSATGGGGIYVDKGELDVIGDSWNDETNAWELVEWGTGTYNPDTEATHTRITHNEATNGNGGGIDAGNGEVDIFSTLIYKNTAAGVVDKGRGGGVYLDGGTINIVTSKILDNTANTNGGGIDDHSGDISIYGGDISYNKAINGRGGGIYTNAGDIRIWPSAMYDNPLATLEECESTGTHFAYNKAGTNGGGLNTHIGRLDVRFANVHHNEAGYNYSSVGTQGGSGGGMFCEGPHADLSGYTVRLIHSDLNENKAYGNSNDPSNLTGRGGGLYLKYGSIFAEHCDIVGNEADINGGGLDNHDGELRVYGSYIDNNKALNGRGGGIYTDKGNLVLGPCDTYGYTESKASRVTNNTAKINGGGVNNHEGGITIHGDRINNNTALTGKGGGVYINSGFINMYGGQINDNQAGTEEGAVGYGGGVYGGGGTFKIMERVPNPIVEILEVEDILTDGFEIHYHLVDRGLAPVENYVLTHGILYIEDGQSWSSDSTYVEFIAGTTGYSFIENEGCVRIQLSGLDSNKTYHVKAWAKYTDDEDVEYYDASPIVNVTTHGDLPVVVTGVGFDITANSASVNGKLFYGGASDVTQKGIEISSDNGATWSSQSSNSVGDVFSVTFIGLSANTEYKARAYAINGNGTGYGDETTFTTSGGSKVMGYSGNTSSSTYPEVEENPFFKELTPLQQAILASTPEGDSTGGSLAKQGRPSVDGPVDVPEINNNTAAYGGGICIDQEGANLIFSGKRGEVGENDPIGQINKNYASEAGGGIYIGKESADKYAQMQMMGKCEVNENHVPAGKYGGGIYLDGRLYVGDKDTDPIGTHGLKVDNNWAVDGASAGLPNGFATNGKLNNVFLTRYEYEYNANATEAGDNKVSVITLLSDISGYADAPTNTNPYSHIGFSVLKGFCPVIATSTSFGNNYNLHDYTPTDESESVTSERWLRNLMVMAGVAGGTGTADALTGAVFEDSESYVAVHTQSDIAPFRCKFIYLWGCWTHPVVKFDPETNNPMAGEGSGGAWLGHYKIKNPLDNEEITETTQNPNTTPLEWEIYSPEGLAWFSAYVNGLNAFDEVTGATDDDNKHHAWNANKNPYAIAHIMNDLDMSAYLWVPIGSVKYFFINSIGNDQGGSLFVDAEKELTIDGHTYNDNHKFKGTFDGHGHVINGLQGLYLTGIKKYGLFGYLDDGAVVKNTFVDEGFFVSDDKDVVYSAGGIAGKMNGGTLSNSEARMDFNVGYSGAGTAVGGLVGEVETTDSEETILIHSSMAMPFITGHDKGEGGSTPTYNAFEGYMGGLVGKLGTRCDLKNSFSNLEVVLTPEGDGSTATRHIGGLVGENNGTVENCYTRYQGATTPSGFGWSAGTNNGTVTFCYIPNEKSPYVADGDDEDDNCTTYGTTELVSGKYGFRHRDQQMTENNNNGNIINDVFLGGLLPTLNKWVDNNTGYSKWTRTMASPINDDYPVLVFEDFNSVGSKDKIYLLYEDDINHMWNAPVMDGNAVSIPGKDFQALNTPESVAAMYLYDKQPETMPAVTITDNTYVPLHIHEDVGITQNTGNQLYARVGVTITDNDWHLFSSALAGAPMGLVYRAGGPVNSGNDAPENVYYNRDIFDPEAMTEWTQSSAIYFPTDTPYGTWRPNIVGGQTAEEAGGYFDLYDYSESYYHWINYKRDDNDHWHMDADKVGNHKRFSEGYENDRSMISGKGYLMSLSSVSMMMADGVLNNNESLSLVLAKSDKNSHLQTGENARTDGGYTSGWRGIHLLGNPYQSYLNFGASGSKAADEGVLPTYAILDESLPGKDHYIYYTVSQSRNVPLYASGVIHPHQGFFVKVNDGGGSFTFSNNMRQPGMEVTPFRDNIDYPLVNLLCYDEDGERDLTTVEVNRPEFGGGQKMESLHKSKGMIYAQLEGESFQVLFAPEGVTNIPVRFEAKEDGNFTLNWNTYHGEFSYLHLIDNITGVDVDCLTTDEYKFEGKTSDYKSRFKLVFRCEGDEPEDPEEPDDPDDGEDSDHFAFMFGDELVVNGEGLLQMFDIQGRCLMQTQALGQQSSHSLPKVAAGVYVFRLTGDKKVKVQKMVIK